MIGRWARRAANLYDELREVADLGADPRWWLLAGGAAVEWDVSSRAPVYVSSDAEPGADTFIGHATPAPRDPFAHAVARALAARAAIRALDGKLPAQPLAVTVRRTGGAAVAEPSALETVAFAIGDRTWTASLAMPAELASDLARVAGGGEPRVLQPLGSEVVPFACVTLGDEPLATARHGHRRAWLSNGTGHGPWLGLSRAGGLDVVSTCHMILDGFGHAWLAAEIAARLNVRRADDDVRRSDIVPAAVPPGTIPLAIAWRPLGAPIPSALPLAYALGRVLHGALGRPEAPFSPTFQIPVAPGERGDPDRRRRRVVPAIASVRFEHGVAEPFAVFEARTRALLLREAAGNGLAAHLLAAAQGAPAPLAWKRRAVGAHRPRWLEALATLVGGRGCVSRIRLDVPGLAVLPACAVSSPGRLPTASDPLGGCVITIVDDGAVGAITLSGAGFAGTDARAAELLDEILAALPAVMRV